MMGAFKNGAFKKLIMGLSIAAVLSLSYGIYAKVTYQPPFLDISVNGTSYTIFGDIGEIGYYSDGLVTKGEETKINLVTWNELNLDGEVEIFINYPSGKEASWTADVSAARSQSAEGLEDEDGIKEIYQFSSYTFKDAGDVTLTIKDNGNKLADFSVEVKK